MNIPGLNSEPEEKKRDWQRSLVVNTKNSGILDYERVFWTEIDIGVLKLNLAD